MDIDPSELDCKNATVFVKSNPEINIPFCKVARKFFVDNGPLVGRGAYTPPKVKVEEKNRLRLRFRLRKKRREDMETNEGPISAVS